MKSAVYTQGYEAYEKGRREKDNPYPQGSLEFEEWRDGWYDAFSYVQYLDDVSDYWNQQ